MELLRLREDSRVQILVPGGIVTTCASQAQVHGGEWGGVGLSIPEPGPVLMGLSPLRILRLFP